MDVLLKAAFEVHFSALIMHGRNQYASPKTLLPAAGALSSQEDFSALALNKDRLSPSPSSSYFH